MLAKLRQVTQGFLKDTCTIEQAGNTVGAFGQQVPGWTVVASGVACRIITESVRKMEPEMVGGQGGQESLAEVYRLVVPVGTALAAGQRVRIGTDYYHVVRLLTERTDETDEQAILTRARVD